MYVYYTVWGEDGLENILKACRISDGRESELKICSPDGSNSVTVGEYVNSYLVEDERIFYLDYGSDNGYIPADLKCCSLSGAEVQVLAENLNALSFSMAGDHTIYYAAASEGTDTIGSGYLFYNYQTGETKKVAESGTYMQFLCGDGSKSYLERENQIVVYDMKAGRFLDNTYPAPEGGCYVAGFLLNSAFWAVEQSSDNQVDAVRLE